ncbi:MAG TPA: DUF1833 family protein [Bradyrhizobium sp.]|nr:DUF1833 family protein [Bradyrhizobium sp.]
MPRTLNANFRDTLEAAFSSEVLVWFATITHNDLDTPVTVNSDVVDYVYNGVTYIGCAFAFTFLADDDQLPKGQVTIENVDQAIGNMLIALPDSPVLHLQLMVRSDFDTSVPRQPIGTPTVEIDAPLLKLRNVQGDVLQITADVYGYDLTTEPWPSTRSTRSRLPGLYA